MGSFYSARDVQDAQVSRRPWMVESDTGEMDSSLRSSPLRGALRASVGALRAPRCELPTARSEEVTVENQPNRNSKLDGPPSPLMPLRSVESRQSSANRYVFATLTVERRMSALPKSGHSNCTHFTILNGCFRLRFQPVDATLCRKAIT